MDTSTVNNKHWKCARKHQPTVFFMGGRARHTVEIGDCAGGLEEKGEKLAFLVCAQSETSIGI